ncbi:MAG: M14 family zinc carboxypeptidase [Ignavibacteria bacterium]|nr:M14 family zinc carboxypeptidase [Ignavibacteria bacterium]
MIMFRAALVIAATALLFLAPLRTLSETGSENYSTVLIRTSSMEDFHALLRSGLAIEHFTGSPARGIEVVLDGSEIALLESTGLPFDILVEDLQEEFRARSPRTPADIMVDRSIMAADNIRGFELGTMGGFYTLDEIATELDSMFQVYPELITQRVSIGLSHEGREIWMVKISDNPNVNESGTEPAVYYDALHHAREPGSMMTTMYFMYWLLENYSVDPRATFLVDNRELFFVPVVNPDGYAYNEQTNPNGGGLWRKNRRVNAGSCFGVDLNRNYSFGYGLNSGSSSDPCASNYRGPSAFSEPESHAVQGLLSTINPVIAFSCHTHGEKFLNPYGYIEEAPAYETYAEFSSDFVAGSSHLYGITAEMLGYFSSGTTRDYLHSEGTFAWTPEFGAFGFWPPTSTIIATASENRHRFEYIARVAGAFADLKNVRFTGSGFAAPGDSVTMTVGIRNRGLTGSAENVHVSVATDYVDIVALNASTDHPSIPAGETVHNTMDPFIFVLGDSAGTMDRIPFFISVTEGGVETSVDTVWFTVGTGSVLASDDAESGAAGWTSSGTGLNWDSTFVDSYDGSYSFADSRYGNSENNTDNYFTMAGAIDLTGAANPVLTFAAKWSIEETFDYARAQVSTNGGVTWWNLTGLHTIPVLGQPSFTGTRHWVVEEMDLSAYVGSVVNLRFHLHTDGGIPGDGFYFDDLRVIDFDGSGTTAVGSDGGPVVLEAYLDQNHPNPFNPATTISYHLRAAGPVSLRVYDLLGREVNVLVDEVQSAGSHSARWNGDDALGNEVTSGVYFYRIATDGLVQTRKLILAR